MNGHLYVCYNNYNKNKEYAQHYINQGKAQAERSLKKVGDQKLILAQKHYEENKAKAKKFVESEYAKTLKLSNIYKVQKKCRLWQRRK